LFQGGKDRRDDKEPESANGTSFHTADLRNPTWAMGCLAPFPRRQGDFLMAGKTHPAHVGSPPRLLRRSWP
ncbi:MAG: hypothetical protein AAGD47_13645, partial [Pseudomonadota bacterium]